MSTGVVKARDGLNVRKGPGTGYAKLGKLKNNTTVSLNGRQNGWYSINYSGRKGYICGTYVSVSGGATATGGGGGGGSYTITASSLNVRKGAGTGVILVDLHGPPYHISVPRVCGGDPRCRPGSLGARRCSPRVRG